jgi:hypothetical protein
MRRAANPNPNPDAALLALLRLASVTVGTAAALSMSCCSAACESCPASFCKDSDADKAPRAAVPELTAAAPSVRAPEPIARFEPVAVVGFRVLPSGFVRPMRR